MGSQLNYKVASQLLSEIWGIIPQKQIPDKGLDGIPNWVVTLDRVTAQIFSKEDVDSSDLDWLRQTLSSLPDATETE